MPESDDEDTPQSAADQAVALARRGGAGLIFDFTTETAARIAGGRFRRGDRIAPGAAAEDDVSTRQRQFENEVERSVCEQRVREPNVGRFFGTVLYLRNSDRGLWFGGGQFVTSSGTLTSPGFSRGFQRSIRNIERLITGPVAQPGGDSENIVDMAARHGNWPPTNGDNRQLPYVDYLTTQGSNCIPMNPVNTTNPDFEETGRYPTVLWRNQYTMYDDPRRDRRYGQQALVRRAAQNVRCESRTVENMETNMIYPDPTCVGATDMMIFSEGETLTADDNPWCWGKNCISDAYVQAALVTPNLHRRGPLDPGNPRLGDRNFILVTVPNDKKPLWDTTQEDPDVNNDYARSNRRLYLGQRAGEYGTTVYDRDDDEGNPRYRDMEEFWTTPRGVIVGEPRPGARRPMSEGRDTFIADPTGPGGIPPLVLKDWATVKIIRVRGFYDPFRAEGRGGGGGARAGEADERLPPGTAADPLYNNVAEMKTALGGTGYSFPPRDAISEGYIADDTIPQRNWVWVEVMDTEMCVDHYNDDNLNWGLWGGGSRRDGSATGNVADPSQMMPTATYKQDDRDCSRKQEIDIMLKGGNWHAAPRRQDITKLETVFCIPINFLVGLSFTLGDAKEKGQELFRKVAQGLPTGISVSRARQLIADVEDGYCNPDNLEGQNTCDLSNPEMLSCLQNSLSLICPCENICSNGCRNFIQEYWNSNCRCEVTNWLNSNTEHPRFEEIQQTATDLNTILTSECRLTPTECDSTTGCCSALGGDAPCSEQHSEKTCKEAGNVGGQGQCMWFDPCEEKDDAGVRCQHMEEGNCLRHQDDRCDVVYNSQGFVECKTKVNNPRGPEIVLPEFNTDVPDSTFRFITPNCTSMDADHIGETVNEKRNCTQSVDTNMNACFYDGDGFDSCESTQNSVSGNLVMHFQDENGDDVPCGSPEYNGVNACSDNNDPNPPSFSGPRGIYKDKCEVSHNKNTGVRCKWTSKEVALADDQTMNISGCEEMDVTDLEDTPQSDVYACVVRLDQPDPGNGREPVAPFCDGRSGMKNCGDIKNQSDCNNSYQITDNKHCSWDVGVFSDSCESVNTRCSCDGRTGHSECEDADADETTCNNAYDASTNQHCQWVSGNSWPYSKCKPIDNTYCSCAGMGVNYQMNGECGDHDNAGKDACNRAYQTQDNSRCAWDVGTIYDSCDDVTPRCSFP